MKRIIPMLLALVLILTVAAFPVSAADMAVTLTPSVETVAPGDTLTVTIALADAPEAKSVGVSVTLPEGVETVSAAWLADDFSLSYYDVAKNKGAAARNAAADYSGDLLRLTLRVAEDCAIAPVLAVEVTLKDGTGTVGSATASLTLAVEGAPVTPAADTAAPSGTAPSPWLWIGLGAALLLIAALVVFLLKKRKSAAN